MLLTRSETFLFWTAISREFFFEFMSNLFEIYFIFSCRFLKSQNNLQSIRHKIERLYGMWNFAESSLKFRRNNRAGFEGSDMVLWADYVTLSRTKIITPKNPGIFAIFPHELDVLDNDENDMICPLGYIMRVSSKFKSSFWREIFSNFLLLKKFTKKVVVGDRTDDHRWRHQTSPLNLQRVCTVVSSVPRVCTLWKTVEFRVEIFKHLNVDNVPRVQTARVRCDDVIKRNLHHFRILEKF